MALNTINTLISIKDQREELLTLNNDLLYWVYSLKEEKWSEFELDFLENVLTCYPNQLNNLKWLKNNCDITILNLGALRKWNIEVLSWNNVDIENPVLLSNGVIEFVEATNKNWETNKHLISTLRDGWAADELQRTTTAGRNSWSDLKEDLEREHIEESPFLWYDKEGNLALATIDNSEESKKILKESINFYIENKYLSIWDDNYVDVEKNFERNFPWVKYSQLGNILKEIIDNDRINTYSSKWVNQFEWLESDMKEISLWGSKWKYFVYFDRENNTIEYRLLRTIKWFDDWFKPLSKRPSRLYLESENQYPRIPRIENASEWYVPTVKYFSELVEKLIWDKLEILSMKENKITNFLSFCFWRKSWEIEILNSVNSKEVSGFLLEQGVLKLYQPRLYENTKYDQGTDTYHYNWSLVENAEGQLMLDCIEIIKPKTQNTMSVRIWFFSNPWDSAGSADLAFAKEYDIKF